MTGNYIIVMPTSRFVEKLPTDTAIRRPRCNSLVRQELPASSLWRQTVNWRFYNKDCQLQFCGKTAHWHRHHYLLSPKIMTLYTVDPTNKKKNLRKKNHSICLLEIFNHVQIAILAKGIARQPDVQFSIGQRQWIHLYHPPTDPWKPQSAEHRKAKLRAES